MDRSLRRRSLLRAAGIAGAAALAGCPAGIGESSEFEPGETDWPGYRFDARNNAVHPSAPGPGGDLSVAWTARYRQEPGEFAGTGVVSAPIVLDGTVFAAADVLTEGGRRTVVSAFDLASGDRQWERALPLKEERDDGNTAPSRTLGSDGERLFVAANAENWVLHALALDGGETEWKQTLDHPAESPITADAGSLVVGDRLYATFDAADGRRQDRYETGNDQQWRNRFPPTVTEDTVYATAHDELHAVDRESGERGWTATNDFYSTLYRERAAPFNSPVVVDGVAYAVCGRVANYDTGGMVAISNDDGSELWTAIPEGATGSDSEGENVAEEQAAFYGMPLVLGDTVYAHGFENGEWGFFAVDAADGSVERMDSVGGLVAADGVVYGASGGDRLTVHATDPTADEELGSASVDDWERLQVGPQAVAGEFFVVATNEGIAAFGPN